MVTVPAQPDLEAFVWRQLEHLAGVTCFSVAAVPMPLVPWQVAHTIQIDARAKPKASAWDRAEEARRIVWALPEVPWPQGVISYVQVEEGPFWAPDDDGSPRYVMRAQIRVHPVPSGPPVPMAEARAAGPVREE